MEPLGTRGQALFDELSASKQFNPVEMVLVVEACRMADRLEKFNDIITGKGVLELMHFRVRHAVDDQGVVSVEMSVDGVLAEARQLQLAFQRVAMTLKLESGAIPVAEVDLGDDLAAQRANRIARAKSS